ncbi:DNA-binding transcriptional LysR family regulator [Anaerospora hongkongensis]|uniref:DNA-binding transcriptional LysR family regulator n=1 Tax=Anaerospora hongkongensis TaxID=244830 RepID=A0A4R1PZ87_9FIRM|nr:LysR family transcriptional regulator [Anaerospora hongkongensis]TCL38191.1 DNA-binding transcriptional LysR family regulator [Anaerospora hongkongensis]
METQDWLILKVLFHTKNITKAAQTLFLSQPAITHRLRHMEEEFGVTIVQRASKGVHFTPQGEYLAKAADAMLVQFRQLKDDLLNMEDAVTGTLRLGSAHVFTKHRLPGLLKVFKNNYPNVEFKVTTTRSKDIFSLLYKQDIQVGFIRGASGWNGEKHLLFDEAICIASKEPFDIMDLPQLPRIDYQTDPTIQALIDNWWRETYPVPPLISMNVDRVDICKEMILNGLGYAFLPDILVNESDNLYKYIITDKAGKPILRQTWMIYQNTAIETNVVNAFVKCVKSINFKTFFP